MPKSTQPKVDDRTEVMRRTKVEDIEKSYTAGEINYNQRGSLLREKAIQVNADAFGDQGYMMAARKIFMKELNKGWENYKEAAAWEAEAGDQGGMQKMKDELYHAGLSLWGQIQMLNALPSAFGQASGLVMERMALQSGASAGLAKWIGIAADFGTGFIPSAMAAKTTGNVIKAAQKAVGAEKTVAKVGKEVVEEAVAKRETVEKVIDQSMKVDGVKNTVFSAAGKELEVGSQKLPKRDLITTETGTVIDRATGEVIPSYLAGAQQAAAEKLGVPTEEVHKMLTGWAPEQIAKGDIEGAAQTFLKDVNKMTPEQAGGIKNMLSNEQGSVSIPENVWGKVVEVYRNMLLAGPAGRTRDLIANFAATGLHVAQRGMGTVVGASGETTMMGTAYYVKGMSLALHEAFDSAASAFTRAGMEGVTKFDKPLTREIPGLFGDIVNIPTSVTVGIDRGFKATHRRASLYAQELENSAKQGRAFDIQNVNLPTKETWEKAVQTSEYLTFQNELGAFGRNISKGLQALPGGELYFPFLKTPINLMKYSWNNTPGLQIASGRLLNEIKAGGEAADMAMGRLTISNMFAFYVSELVKNEMITGSGPANPQLREAWLKTHEPYSIRAGDKWVPYPFVGPIAQTIGMISDFTQGMHDLDTPKIEQIGQSILLAIENNIGDNSWFQGVKTLTDAAGVIGKSDTAATKLGIVAARPFFTMATGGSAGSEVKRLIDPVSRDARTVMDSFYAKTPWGSTTVPPKRDGLGDVIIPPEVIGGRWAGVLGNPIKTVEKTKDRVRFEADRLKVKFPVFEDNIGGSEHAIDLRNPQPGDKIGVQLTPQQHDQRMQLYGNILEHGELGMPALMNTEEYRGAPDALKRQMFQGNLTDAWKTSGEALMELHPELRVKQLQNDARRYLPQLTPGPEQERAKQDIQEATDYFQQLPPNQMDNLLRFTPVD